MLRSKYTTIFYFMELLRTCSVSCTVPDDPLEWSILCNEYPMSIGKKAITLCDSICVFVVSVYQNKIRGTETM